ncbi:glycoside hydrolase family 63 protein [Lentithecium fluviatile CBS 122367]|uniref:Mannosyl-oligosaccharide glucosidase n=1 Tax=Lentithecium fluviatile CBS 122367 TaxID=1168545 RepID=A0A6G1JQ35_9PLEO|nr:glycoside hydrolase family 63 protein [Lentithecium fluviatile CBS 122367]
MQLPTPLVYAILAILTPEYVGAEVLSLHNASLLWGPYRPNLYLGIRPRVPESLLMGLMWGKLDGGDEVLRHTCEAADNMSSYGWTAYDTRHGGTQMIQDKGNSIDITTDFVKKYEGQSAGNWALRIRGTPREDAKVGSKMRVVFYVGMEEMDKCGKDCQLDAVATNQGQGDDLYVETVDIHMKHPKLGVAEIRIPSPRFMSGSGKLDDMVVKSVKAPNTSPLWKTKSLFTDVLNQNGRSLSNQPGTGSVHFVQLIFQDNFEFDILYSTQSATVAMTSAELTRGIESTLQSFKSKFSSVFAPKAPFNTEEHILFSQTMLSNLQGGLGYFYGDTKVDTSNSPGYDETTATFWDKARMSKEQADPRSKGPYELLSHVPSRSFFPRGFLWDEGFHLLQILEWDADVALEIVHSWLALMDDEGWIAREQILGEEARSKVPESFQVQYPHIANPPTLFWIVSKFVDMLKGDVKYAGYESLYLSSKEKGKELVAELYPKLKLHYDWWRRTQPGDVEVHSRPRVNLDEGYRWRGRTPETNYASGLDDYPRAEPPDISELHVDALTWVGVMAEILGKLALYTEDEPDIVTFQSQLRNIRHNIDALHWSEEHQMYCDARVWDDAHAFTCPKGYVALFPFLTGFLGPEHPHLNATLDIIRDPKHLWTDFGVRSLSPLSTRYGLGDNYWRSPIWINMNYLIIERLLDLAQRPGPTQQRCREIYVELRRNIVTTVYASWKSTGYAWENFDASSGRGQGTQGFTGWTALVVKIMAFPDLEMGETTGVKGKIGWVVKEVEGGEGWGVGGVVFAAVAMAFIYVTRRRFVGTLRGLKRKL